MNNEESRSSNSYIYDVSYRVTDHENKDSRKTITRFGILSDSLEYTRKIVTNLLLISLVTILTFIVVKQMINNFIIIEPIHIPKVLEDKGLTPEIVSQQIIDAMHRIHKEAWTAKKAMSAETDNQNTDIELPGTRTTLKTVINTIGEFLNIRNETKVSGEILILEPETTSFKKDVRKESLYIRLRIEGKEKKHLFEIENSDINELLFSAAQSITYITDPIVYASHQYFGLQSAHGTTALREIISTFENSENKEKRAWAKYFEATLYLDDGRHVKAEQHYKEAIRLQPTLADAYNDLAKLYTDMRDYHKGVQAIELGLKNIKDERLQSFLYARWANIIRERANINQTKPSYKLLDEALHYATIASRLNPDLHSTYLLSGRILYEKGMITKAEEKFNLALHLKPMYKQQIYNEWGSAVLAVAKQANIDQIDEAIALFRKAEQANTRSLDVLINLGYSYLYKSKLQEGKQRTNSRNKSISYFEKARNNHHDKNYVDFHNGIALFQINQHKLAIEKFITASKDKPENANYHAWLGISYYRNRAFQKAEDSFNQAMSKSQNNPQYYTWWAYELASIRKYEESEDKFRKAIRLMPSNAEFHYGLSYTLKDKGDYESALHAISKAVQLDKDISLYYNHWGNILYDLERWNDATERYRQAIALQPNSSTYYSNLGQALYNQSQIKAAEQAFTNAVTLDKNNAKAFNSWGNSLFSLKDWKGSAEKYRKAIELNSQNPVYFTNLGGALEQLKQYDETIKIYKKVVKLTPNDPNIYNLLGNSLYSLQRWNLSAEQYQKAINLDSKAAVYHSNLAQSLYQAKRYDESSKAYIKAIKLEPRNHRYRNSLGNTFFALQKGEKAIEQYTSAIDLAPDTAVYHFNLGLSYELIQDFEQSRNSYIKAVSLDKDNASYHNKLGNILIQLNDEQSAEGHYRTAIELNPKNSIYMLNLGNTLHTLENHTEDIRFLSIAAQLDSTNALIYYFWGEVLYSHNHVNQALDKFKTANELEPKNTTYLTRLADIYYVSGEIDEAERIYDSVDKINLGEGISTLD